MRGWLEAVWSVREAERFWSLGLKEKLPGRPVTPPHKPSPQLRASHPWMDIKCLGACKTTDPVSRPPPPVVWSSHGQQFLNLGGGAGLPETARVARLRAPQVSLHSLVLELCPRSG